MRFPTPEKQREKREKGLIAYLNEFPQCLKFFNSMRALIGNVALKQELKRELSL